MRHHLAILCLMLGAGAHAQSLLLKVSTPGVVSLGEPFTVTVTLSNESKQWARIAPVFTPSPKYLALHLANGSDQLPTPTIVDETEGSISPASFVLLAPGAFIGRTFRISADPEDSLVSFTGLQARCYALSASLQLHAFSPEFTWPDGIKPTEAVVEAEPVKICFGPPLSTSTKRHQKLIGSGDYEERVRAYAYFANVNDPSAVTELVRILGNPHSWRSRAVDELLALKMMKRQCDRRLLPYLRESLTGRYSSFAESAMHVLEAGCK